MQARLSAIASAHIPIPDEANRMGIDNPASGDLLQAIADIVCRDAHLPARDLLLNKEHYRIKLTIWGRHFITTSGDDEAALYLLACKLVIGEAIAKLDRLQRDCGDGIVIDGQGKRKA